MVFLKEQEILFEVSLSENFHSGPDHFSMGRKTMTGDGFHRLACAPKAKAARGVPRAARDG